ncbi:MAG: hypothetical protein HOI47_30570 [Candidatus Scalindua sp.]|jgi:hypothetical protein|nr:hypothetical protein [Candidatus Scalindua sp.]
MFKKILIFSVLISMVVILVNSELIYARTGQVSPQQIPRDYSDDKEPVAKEAEEDDERGQPPRDYSDDEEAAEEETERGRGGGDTNQQPPRDYSTPH